MEKGYIRPIMLRAPIVFVKKKDVSLRLCIKYNELNKVTIKKKYTLPRIHYIFDQLKGVGVFSKINLRSEYHQLKIFIGDILKTTFWTCFGHFEFTLMPLVLTKASTTFIGLMNQVFCAYLDKIVIIYISLTKEENEEQLHML